MSALIAENRRARFEYHIEEQYEAGMVLEGWEVKAIRAGQVQLTDGYVVIRNGELFLIGCRINALRSASTHVHPEADRTKKLLMGKDEIRRLIGKVEQRGFTLVPLNLHWKGGRAKAEIALAKGKAQHDKRDTEKKRDWEREKGRLMRHKVSSGPKDWAVPAVPLDDVLHPPIEPLRTGWMPVSDLHTLYWETCGNPQGIPVVFLHGGPGAGISPRSRRFFDPARYHVVLFDQRGAGQSTPLGETRENTTPLLIGDIERLREQLGIERWLVFGGSWGSTLSLAYAQAHPERCLGLVLRGIWLASEAELDWWLYGVRNFFPREWEAFAGHVPEAERGDLLAAYSRRLESDDPEVYGPAARAWSRYEGSCLHLLPHPDTADAFTEDAVALGIGRLEAHYFRHKAFLQPEQLLAGMGRIRHLPGFIVHGRYDVICPVRYAHDLMDAWPGVVLDVQPDAGHSSYEPGIAAALVAATDGFARDGRFG